MFVLIDGSIPPQQIDIDFVHTLDEEDIPFAVVMTKMDKATQKELALHQRLLQEKFVTGFSRMPKIFTVSNVSKK